jgi:hypothetical protein
MAGTITVGELLSDPTSNNKITIGSGTTLDLVNGAGSVTLPALGKVLQVVSVLTNTQASQTITTSDTQVGLLTKSITPVGANSKFSISVRWFGEVTTGQNVLFNIQQDGTRVNINGQGRGYGLAMPLLSYYTANNSTTPENVNFTTLVSTSSVVGTAIVFKVVADASASYTLWNNRSFSTPASSVEAGTSELIITEIGA